MTVIPKNILDPLTLAGPPGSRPFDRLQRAKPLAQGKDALSKLSLKDFPALTDPSSFLHLQAALYLQFDLFDEAHQIAQDQEGAIGNWLHAIAHRREPDASNSKYWYARVKGMESAYLSIGSKVVSFALSDSILELEFLGAKIAKAKTWLPEAFVDVCERFREKDPGSEVYQGLAHIQQLEWQGLVETILAS